MSSKVCRAVQPRRPAIRSEALMQYFSSILLLNILRGILDDLEQRSALDPTNPALVQLRFTVSQQIEGLQESGRIAPSLSIQEPYEHSARPPFA